MSEYWPRSLVRTITCPYCEASPETKCVGVRGQPRESNHAERIAAYAAAQGAGGDG
jgi:hypothetical protein